MHFGDALLYEDFYYACSGAWTKALLQGQPVPPNRSGE